MPLDNVHTAPVPTHAMHVKKCRRSRSCPSSLRATSTSVSGAESPLPKPSVHRDGPPRRRSRARWESESAAGAVGRGTPSARETASPGDVFPGINRVRRVSLVGVKVSRTFEDTVLPHLDAAFNYARWLTRNEAEAEDVVQDACVRAVRFFSSLRDDDARAWLFAIVRNAWYSRVSRRAGAAEPLPLDGTMHDPADS